MLIRALLGPVLGLAVCMSAGAVGSLSSGAQDRVVSSSPELDAVILAGNKQLPPTVRLPKPPKQTRGAAGKTQAKPPVRGNLGARGAARGAAAGSKALPMRNAFGTAVGKPGAYRHMNRSYKIPTKESRTGTPLFKSLPQKIDRSKLKSSAQGFTPKNLKKNQGGVRNATRHYELHGKNFRSKSVADYVRKAQRFRNNPPAGTERRVLRGGDVALYNKKTNTLLIHNRNGAIKTFYKPGPRQTKNGRGYDPKKFKNAYDFFKKGLK
ncbi:MAG: hypothetical protein AAF317_06475 [Pseudomonadota bacterium]